MKKSIKINGKDKTINYKCDKLEKEEEVRQLDKAASPSSNMANVFSKPAFKI